MARTATLAGVGLIIVGMMLPYAGFYSDAFFLVIAAGFALTFCGAVAWLWRATRRKRAAAGGIVLLAAAGSAALGISNVHTWGLFLLVAAPTAALGLVLLTLALFRGRTPLGDLSRRVRAESMRVNAEFAEVERDPQA